jgi:hypothetical protein
MTIFIAVFSSLYCLSGKPVSTACYRTLVGIFDLTDFRQLSPQLPCIPPRPEQENYRQNGEINPQGTPRMADTIAHSSAEEKSREEGKRLGMKKG